MRILNRRWTEVIVTWTREFDLKGGHGRGYTFPCDARGVIDTSKLEPAGLASLETVQGHPDYLDRGACAHTRQVTHPAIGVCEQCTALVSLERWTNQCDQCGAEYNGEGQRLADRALWGTETNEHPADLGRLA
jgi:hypothetical protein